MTNLHGKVCLVTGATSGIGKATALGLARMGATVVMVSRDRGRGEATRNEVRTKSGNDAVDLLIANLDSQAAIRQLAQMFKATHPTLHVLINNAGVNVGQRTLTQDGIEMTFAVNHLAPFLLTLLLLDALKASAPARIINIGSGFQVPIDFDDLTREKRYRPTDVYAQSKMANALFTVELAKRLRGTGITVNCANPGFVNTNLGRDAGGMFRMFLAVMRPFMKTPEQGAETPLYLASASEVEGINGRCFENKKETQPTKASHDTAAAERLWQVSEQLTQRSASCP